jgi:hypothetical protein
MNTEPFKIITESAQDYKEKKISNEILSVLKKFIESNKNLITRSTNTSYDLINLLSRSNNRWLLVIFFTILGYILSTLVFSGFKLYLFVYLLILLLIPLLLVTGNHLYTLYKYIKKIRVKAISIVENYDLEPYHQIIEYLGETFYEENLKREEFRFKLALNETKRRVGILEKATPLLAILLVVMGIYILGSPSENSEMKFMYGTIVGIPGIAFLVKVILDIIYKWLDYQTIDVYEKCVLILQAAQLIAKEEELDAVRTYDEAISSGNEVIPFEQAISEIERNR